MAYSIQDIEELIQYHLIASSDSDDAADCKLVQLVQDIGRMVKNPAVPETIYWMACEECGAWVSSELIVPEGAGKGDDSGFYCTTCRFGENE